VEYEEYNKMFLKIVLDKYFDKNEFYTGDIIMIKNYRMPYYASKTDPEYTDYMSNRYNYDLIMSFINRPEGHTIVEFGQANQEGFYRNFYIAAPSMMDATQGKYIIEKTLVDTIQAFNSQNYACCVNPTPNGQIMNTSLQITLNMQMKLAIGDAVDVLTPQIL
jgi:hypothetical protein